jgi:hypothetical protein
MKQSEQVEGNIFPVVAKQGLSKIWNFGSKKYKE